MPGEFRLHYIFDTSAIFDLGALDEVSWRAVENEWNRRALKTTWLPTTLAEVACTSLANRADAGWVGQRLVAIQRFNSLAKSQFLPDIREHVRRSFHELGGEPLPPASDIGLSSVLDVILSNSSRPTFKTSPREWSAHYTSTDGGECRITVPMTFSAGANLEIERRSRTTSLTDGADHTRLIQEIAPRLERAILELGILLEVPQAIISRAMAQPSARVMCSAFAYGAAAWLTYIEKRATGSKSRVKENDSRDLAVSCYLSDAERVVVCDKDLAKLLKAILKAEARVVSFPEFLAQLGVREG